MTPSKIELWEHAATAFDQRHKLVEDKHLGLPTPCDDFDVAALIRHAVDTQIGIGGLLGAATDTGAPWESTRAALAARLTSPDVIVGEAEHPGLGPTPKRRLLEIATHDLLVHTWDLSQALGVDATLPAPNLEPAIQSILAFPAPVREALFAQPFDDSGTQDSQARLLAISGRQS